MPTNQSTPKQNSRSGGRAYSYGSDDESEARVPLQGRPSIYQQQRPMPAHQHPQHEHVVYDPPWDHINFDQMRSAHRTAQTSESDEDNRHALQRYSQAGKQLS